MTMKTANVMAELARIADVYPTLRGLMNKKLKSGSYLGQHWAESLTRLNPSHFADVCDEYASLERELPDPADRLPFEIASEVRERVGRDVDRLRSMEIQLAGREAKKGSAWKYVRSQDAKGDPDAVIFTGIPGVHTLRELEEHKANQ